jgi:pyrroloquinoline quinone biosynthesis protein B
MRAVVLGAAAGGSFPQWNCGCENCVLARAHDPRVTPRTQDSLAIFSEPLSSQRGGALLVNASPEISRQIEATPALHPRSRRDTPITAIAITNGDLDHTIGLFSLRESQPLIVYATDRVWRGLVDRNAIMRTLARFEGQVTHRRLILGEPVDVPELNLTISAFAAPSKLPVHLMSDGEAHAEDNVLLRISENDKTITYATALKNAGDVIAHLENSDALFLDGTFWSSEELVSQGLSKARAEDMAHHPLSGEKGSLATLAKMRNVRRKILTHINNTNPILRSDSVERKHVLDLGWEIATDGMQVSL